MPENRIKEYRNRLGLSQVKLGGLVGLAPGVICDFERGARKVWPRARKVLARTLGVTEVDLFPSGQKNGTTDS